jgi:hypothetical protein
MHKIALDALKTRFEGISESVLDRMAKKIAKTATTAEEVKSTVEEVTIQQIIDAEGDRRATDAQKTAVANYERKHGLKDGKTIEPSDPNEPTDTPDAKDPEDMPQWAKALVETNAKLQQQLSAMSSERITNDRKQQLSAVVEQLPEHLQKPYARMKLDGLSDEEFKTTLEDVKTEVGGIVDNLKQSGLVFARPLGGESKGAQELTKAQLEAITHRDGTASKDGQPF